MAIVIHPTRATHDIQHIGVRKGDRMYHVLSDVPGALGGQELRDFVRGCGVRAEWIQYAGTYREHFDAHGHLAECLILRGARLVGNHEIGQLLRDKRQFAADDTVAASSPVLVVVEPDADGTTDEEDVLRWGPVPGVPEEVELRALGEVSGHDVLELDCRTVAWGVTLTQQGARYVAAQSSAAWRERLFQRMQTAGADFAIAASSLPDLLGLRDGGYDIVFAVADVLDTQADLARCLRAIARVLRPGGLCALTALSPFFAVFPNQGSDQLRPTRSYFDRSARRGGSASDDGGAPAVPRYHRTVGDWITDFMAAGLFVTEVLELEPHPRWWHPSSRTDLPWAKVALLPATTIWRARKPNAPVATLW